MTIGPEPRTRILWMSSRLGIRSPGLSRGGEAPADQGRRSEGVLGTPRTEDAELRCAAGSSDQLQEAVEEVNGVVWAWPGFRVVLGGRARNVLQDKSLNCSV